MQSGLVRRILNKYWRAGVTIEIIYLDLFVLGICAIDAVRFVLWGHSLNAAVTVTSEKLGQGEELAVAAAVLLFFLVGLPMLITLVSSLPMIRTRWSHLFVRGRWPLLMVHLLFSFLVCGCTATAITMEVLGGYENNDVLRYGFRSAWLSIVFLGQPLWASYISPIIRKFFIRFPHEKEPITKVASEVITEESFESQHVA